MSSAAGTKELRSAIREHSFAPAYYLFGDDDYLKEEELRRLVDAASDPGTRDFNVDILRGAEAQAEALGSLLATPPIMASRRVLVLRDIGALKRDARLVLDRYLEAPSPPSDQLLILTSPAGGKVDKSISARMTAVEFKPLNGDRVLKWIAYYATHELHCSITPAAQQLLLEATGTELSQLKIELDKLGSFVRDAAIDEQAVSTIVGVKRGETLGDLLEAVARRDAARALELLPAVLQQPKSSAVYIVMALTTQTLALAWGRAMRQQGTTAGMLNRELYSLLSQNRASPTGMAWGDAIKCWIGALDSWTLPELDDALEALRATDAALKESRLSSEQQLLGTLVLMLCRTRRSRAA